MGRLGQKEPALDRAEERESQVVRIGGGAKLAALLHLGEPIFDAVAPHGKTVGKALSRRLRIVGELTRERSQWTSSALYGLVEPNDGVAPSLEGRQRIQRLQMRPLRVENAVGLPGDNLEHQRVLVREVVVELRFAHAACR